MAMMLLADSWASYAAWAAVECRRQVSIRILSAGMVYNTTPLIMSSRSEPLRLLQHPFSLGLRGAAGRSLLPALSSTGHDLSSGRHISCAS